MKKKDNGKKNGNKVERLKGKCDGKRNKCERGANKRRKTFDTRHKPSTS